MHKRKRLQVATRGFAGLCTLALSVGCTPLASVKQRPARYSPSRQPEHPSSPLATARMISLARATSLGQRHRVRASSPFRIDDASGRGRARSRSGLAFRGASWGTRFVLSLPIPFFHIWAMAAGENQWRHLILLIWILLLFIVSPFVVPLRHGTLFSMSLPRAFSSPIPTP
jgi:hypothetical protein